MTTQFLRYFLSVLLLIGSGHPVLAAPVWFEQIDSAFELVERDINHLIAEELFANYGFELVLEKVTSSQPIEHAVSAAFTAQGTIQLTLKLSARESVTSAFEKLALLRHFVGNIAGQSFSRAKLPTVSSRNRLKTPYAWAETLINSANGSLMAKAEVAKAIESIWKAKNTPTNFKKFLSGLGKEMQRGKKLNISKVIQEQQRQSEKEAEVLWAEALNDQDLRLSKWRERVSQSNQGKSKDFSKEIKRLVLANNRKAVKELFAAEIPWEVLEPVEVVFWKGWLESLTQKRGEKQILFRGVSDQRQFTESKGKVFLASPFLSENELGSELGERFLAARQVQSNLGFDQGLHVSRTESISLITQNLLNHSAHTRESPFMSFTTSISIASEFAKDKVIIAARVPKSRLVPNFTTLHSSEFEVLLPMIVFPDEVITTGKPFNTYNANSKKRGVKRWQKFMNEKLSEPIEVESSIEEMFGTTEEKLAWDSPYRDGIRHLSLSTSAVSASSGLRCVKILSSK